MVSMEDGTKDKESRPSGNKSSVIYVKLILFVFCVVLRSLVFHFDCVCFMGSFWF